MAQDYHHGVRVTEVNDGTRYARTINTGIIGIVATANDADPGVFPENIPVLLTNVKNASGKAGDTGTLAQSLDAIASQTSPITVVVRVKEGENEAETTSNVIGEVTANQQYTGMQALRVAQSILGVTPRILGAPGLDNQSVTTQLAGIAQKLRAFCYGKCHGETVSEMIAYRKEFGFRELMLIAPDFVTWNTRTDSVQSRFATAYALGMRSKIDDETGWHKTISNVPVNGPEGITKDISWDLQSSSTDAGLLNENDITTLINYKGYRFWGNRTCSADPMFAFESSVRSSQVIADTIAEAHFNYVDALMSAANARDIVESVNARLRTWIRDGYLLGGNCWYDPEYNTKEELKAGKIGFDYDFTAVPPMEDITFRQRITDRYFADFSHAIVQGL